MLPTKIADVDAAIVQLLAYADELIAARRASPRDDLVTRIAQAADEAKGIDEELDSRRPLRGWSLPVTRRPRTSWAG